MKPRTIEPGQSHQNGDVEALNGAFKRRVEQHLLVRGSRDFEGIDGYETWLQAVAEKANRLREPKIPEELAAIRPLSVGRLMQSGDLGGPGTSGGTLAVCRKTSSIAS